MLSRKAMPRTGSASDRARGAPCVGHAAGRAWAQINASGARHLASSEARRDVALLVVVTDEPEDLQDRGCRSRASAPLRGHCASDAGRAPVPCVARMSGKGKRSRGGHAPAGVTGQRLEVFGGSICRARGTKVGDTSIRSKDGCDHRWWHRHRRGVGSLGAAGIVSRWAEVDAVGDLSQEGDQLFRLVALERGE